MSGKFQIRLAACADNYQFIDFDIGMALDLSHPVGYADRVTPSIRRGLMAGTLVDLNGEATKVVEEFLKELKAKRTPRGGAKASVTPDQVVSTSAVMQESITDPIGDEDQEPVTTPVDGEASIASVETEEATPEITVDVIEEVAPVVTEAKTYTQEELNAMDFNAVKEIAATFEVTGKKKDEIIVKILEKQNA